MLFAFIMEVALREAGVEFEWGKLRRILPELASSDLLFMDDGVSWARDCSDLTKKISDFALVLQRYGLTLNLRKCQLYCTPSCPTPHSLRMGEFVLQGLEGLEVMGLKFAQGMTISNLIHPMLVRAQNKFWSLKHLFRSKVSAVERLKLMHKVVTNSALWCCSAFPPDKSALKHSKTFWWVGCFDLASERAKSGYLSGFELSHPCSTSLVACPPLGRAWLPSNSLFSVECGSTCRGQLGSPRLHLPPEHELAPRGT